MPTSTLSLRTTVMREATFADYPRIAALESRYGLCPGRFEQWKQLWTANPVYRELPHWPIGWVCENANKEVVASIANIPVRYWLGGHALLAATSRSLVTEQLYRSHAVGLLKQFFSQKQVAFFVNTSVNAQAAKLQELFRAQRVPAGTWDRSAFAITNYRAFGARFVSKKGLPSPRILSHALSVGLFLKDTLTGATFPWRRTYDSRAQFCSEFDHRFEEFWFAMRSSRPSVLLADRSCETLQWHFGRALRHNRAWVMAVSEAGKILAYAIFRRQDNRELALSRMRLVDVQILGRRLDLLTPILHAAVHRCRREGIHMLEAIGFSPEKKAAICRSLPYSRPLGSWRYFYKTRGETLAAILHDPQTWDPTCFDGDASL